MSGWEEAGEWGVQTEEALAKGYTVWFGWSLSPVKRLKKKKDAIELLLVLGICCTTHRSTTRWLNQNRPLYLHNFQRAGTQQQLGGMVLAQDLSGGHGRL